MTSQFLLLLLLLKDMLDSLFKNQALMTAFIAFIWLIPGIIFTSATVRKYKYRQKQRQIKKISKLYPQP